MPLTVATVDAIRERLAAIPEKDGTERKVTRLEAIARMTDELLGLRKRGYSWKEVAELVSSEGCRVTVGSLKTVLWKRGVTSTSEGASVNEGGGSAASESTRESTDDRGPSSRTYGGSQRRRAARVTETAARAGHVRPP